MKPIVQTAEQMVDANTLLRARIDSQLLATGVGVPLEAGGEKRLDAMMERI
ncbi:MAG: hypothetical protein WCS52_00840 [bacterium]